MEIAVIIIMLTVGFSFLLKLTFHKPIGQVVLSLAAAMFVVATTEAATAQSKTQIADWLAQPALMLDTSVWLTIDVAFQICFCILSAKNLSVKLSRSESIVRQICLWFPGLLIFPVLFAAQTELIFAMTGVDFNLTGRWLAAAIAIGLPLTALGFKYLLPETDIRLELIFMVNLLTAALGIVATVNGRTAAVGIDSVEWSALAGVVAIIVAGAVAGLFLNKYFTYKQISKLK